MAPESAPDATMPKKGSMMREGTIIDVKLIAVSPSTKNKDGMCNPEMH